MQRDSMLNSKYDTTTLLCTDICSKEVLHIVQQSIAAFGNLLVVVPTQNVNVRKRLLGMCCVETVMTRMQSTLKIDGGKEEQGKRGRRDHAARAVDADDSDVRLSVRYVG